jgi:hypothetical protein
MTGFKCLATLVLLAAVVGCCEKYEMVDCKPYPARLVDVNTERGDWAGNNFYAYRTHELHPDHVRRYDYHPRTYHRFVHEEDGR